MFELENTTDGFLWQWDVNRRLIVSGIESGKEIHFARQGDSESITLLTYEENGVVYVDIPNVLLTHSGMVNIYLYVWVDEEQGYTSVKDSIRIRGREKPSGYVYTETEAQTYAALEKRIEALEKGGVNASSDIITLTDGKNNKTYTLYVEDGKLTMSEVL